MYVRLYVCMYMYRTLSPSLSLCKWVSVGVCVEIIVFFFFYSCLFSCVCTHISLFINMPVHECICASVWVCVRMSLFSRATEAGFKERKTTIGSLLWLGWASLAWLGLSFFVLVLRLSLNLIRLLTGYL